MHAQYTALTKHPLPPRKSSRCLTVRFLESGTSTGTTEDLGLGTSVIGNQEGSVVLDKSLLQLVLGVFVDEFLVVGDDGLGDSLSDGVDLRSVTTTANTDTDVYTGEFVETDDQDWLVNLFVEKVRCAVRYCSCNRHLFLPATLPCIPIPSCWFFRFLRISSGSRSFNLWAVVSYLESEDLWLNEGQWLAVNLDEALALLFELLVYILHNSFENSSFPKALSRKIEGRTLQWATAVAKPKKRKTR